jgi:hypothetical protein
MMYTIDDVPSLKAALKHAEQRFVERASPNAKPMDRLTRIIHLLELGCHRVEDGERGLLVNGRYFVSPSGWAVVGRNKWYRYGSLPTLIAKLRREDRW